MKTVNKCEECGSELRENGHCTKCLFGLAFSVPERTKAKESPEPWRQLGDFDLHELIGRGGMGVVYRARQRSLNRQVAVKMLLPGETKPGARERFRIEAEAGAKLEHPNIVPIYAIGLEGEQCYFSMQLVSGGNLSQRAAEFRLQDEAAMETKAAARTRQMRIALLLQSIAAAVHFAHENGVLHRDLKPQNILLTREGKPMLTDFGLAKVLDLEQSVTDSGLGLGTLSYMAPEQAAGARACRGSDVFSLGAILYELLAGFPPFKSTTPAQTLRRLAEDEPLDLRHANRWIDADLAVICAKCLQKNPQERYSSAEELAEDLGRWMDREPIHARPLSRRLRVQRWVEKNRTITLLMGGLAAGLLAALILLAIAVRASQAKARALEAVQASVGEALREAWKAKGKVRISSEALATLQEGGEPRPVQLGHLRLEAGVFVHQNPIDTVFQYRKLVAHLERGLEEELEQEVRIDLSLYKGLAAELLQMDAADFVRISPTLFLDSRRIGVELQPLVRQENDQMRCVIFARAELGLNKLADLAGHSLIFGEANSSVTVAAQRLLLRSGLRHEDFSNCDHFGSEPKAEFNKGGYLSLYSEPLRQVVEKKYDAGVALERQIAQTQHRKRLTVLASFEAARPIWAARPGLSQEVAAAFARVMERLSDPEILRSLPEDPGSPTGFVRASNAEVAQIEIIQREALEFERSRSNRHGAENEN